MFLFLFTRNTNIGAACWCCPWRLWRLMLKVHATHTSTLHKKSATSKSLRKTALQFRFKDSWCISEVTWEIIPVLVQQISLGCRMHCRFDLDILQCTGSKWQSQHWSNMIDDLISSFSPKKIPKEKLVLCIFLVYFPLQFCEVCVFCVMF